MRWPVTIQCVTCDIKPTAWKLPFNQEHGMISSSSSFFSFRFLLFPFFLFNFPCRYSFFHIPGALDRDYGVVIVSANCNCLVADTEVDGNSRLDSPEIFENR